jgi:hypothetical protein
MMVPQATLTLVIILGPTGNLQGTYTFYNLATGKKIKRRMFMPYPMPNLVIKKIEKFGAGKQDSFDFTDCNGALFEWNNEDDALEGEDLVKENIVLYPSITAEFLGVALTHHITPIEEEFEPHGHVKDAAARNANFGLVAIAGVDAYVIHTTQTRSMTLLTIMMI